MRGGLFPASKNLSALILVVKFLAPTWTTIVHTKHTSDCTIYAHSVYSFLLDRKDHYVLSKDSLFIYLLLFTAYELGLEPKRAVVTALLPLLPHTNMAPQDGFTPPTTVPMTAVMRV